jgi:uncharacterized membrane protein YfcA
MQEIFGFLGAVLIGIVLGLIGGGGSILSVPIFVYVLNIEPVLSTAYSLFVVGTTSLAGTIKNIQKGMVDLKAGIIFSIPAFIAVYLTRRFLVPSIPDSLFSLLGFEVTKNIGVMIFFSFIMIVAAYFMIKERDNSIEKTKRLTYNYPIIIIEGLVIGLLTGIVGAGGGFLIIPALVLLAKLPMKRAVATSLMIIAAKSLIGFIGDIENFDIDWSFLLTFSSLSIIGIYIGTYLNQFIEGRKLKKSFGWFVMLMAIYILTKEIL